MSLTCICGHSKKHHTLEDGCRCLMFGKQECSCLMFVAASNQRPNGWQREECARKGKGLRIDRRDFGDRIRLPVR